MLPFLLRRVLGWAIMIVVAVNSMWFVADALLKPSRNFRGVPPEQASERLARVGLDDRVPAVVRWWKWAGHAARGEWGNSPTGLTVGEMLSFRIGMSAQLLVVATLFTVLIGVALGVFTASRAGSVTDRVLGLVSVISMNVHTVVTAALVVILGIGFNRGVGKTVFYVAGSREDGVSGIGAFVDRCQHVALPALTLVLVGYGTYHLTQRALLLDTIDAGFVRAAQGRGLTRGQAVRRHAFRVSLPPVVTAMAFAVPALFTGAVLVEKIFAWRGVGDYLLNSLRDNDVNGVMAVVVFGAVLTAACAILSDLALVLIDPRVRLR